MNLWYALWDFLPFEMLHWDFMKNALLAVLLLAPLLGPAARKEGVGMLDAMTVLRAINVITGMMRMPVTKEMLNALDPEGANATYPTLTVTAYAVQRSGFEPEISEGATAPTAEQVLAAAFAAWNVIEA